MPPEIAKTLLLDEWVIVTRWHTNKNGVKIANIKYPIPEKTIERIAYEFLLKGMENYEKGYKFQLTDKITNQVFEVTVKRLNTDQNNACEENDDLCFDTLPLPENA